MCVYIYIYIYIHTHTHTFGVSYSLPIIFGGTVKAKVFIVGNLLGNLSSNTG